MSNKWRKPCFFLRNSIIKGSQSGGIQNFPTKFGPGPQNCGNLIGKVWDFGLLIVFEDRIVQETVERENPWNQRKWPFNFVRNLIGK